VSGGTKVRVFLQCVQSATAKKKMPKETKSSKSNASTKAKAADQQPIKQKAAAEAKPNIPFQIKIPPGCIWNGNLAGYWEYGIRKSYRICCDKAKKISANWELRNPYVVSYEQ
jgi:hypothetical protein